MAYVADHLSVAALEERYEGCENMTSSRHFQTIWLLAKGHTVGQTRLGPLPWVISGAATARRRGFEA